MESGHGLFGYSGDFADEHSARLIELASAINPAAGYVQAIRGRLGYVMVETFQNIVRHRADTKDMAPWGDARSLFMLQFGQEGQRLTAENPVTTPQKIKLDGLLNGLRGKTPQQLKTLFMEGMQRTSVPGVRGAGLGLIEMVRRAQGRVDWTFRPIGEALYRFSIMLELGDQLAMPGAAFAPDALRGMAMRHRLSLIYSGKWSPGMQSVLLKISGAGPATVEQVDRAGAWLAVAPSSFLVVHGDEHRMLLVGGLLHPEAAKQMVGRFVLHGGTRVQQVPVEGAELVFAEMPLV